MQKQTRIVATAAVAALAAGLGAGSIAAAHGRHDGHAKPPVTKRVTCTLKLVAVLPPRTRLAENFGTIDCAGPLGSGVQHDSSTVTPTSTTGGTFAGPVKQFFDDGTLAGTFTIAYTVAPGGAVTYDGAIDLTTGTGRYRHLTGTGTLTGTSPDAIRTTITEELTLSGKRR